MKNWYKYLPQIIAYAIVLALFILTCNNSFYWDTIQLASQHANYFFDNGFTNLLPDNLDSGHIPSFGIYIAVIWKIFGRNLLISHLAMLPFILGIVWQLNSLTRRYIDLKYSAWAAQLILIDPTLLAQMTLVSPDIVLVFFFLLAINSILGKRCSVLALAIIMLFLVSMRGMMVSFCLMIFDIIINVDFKSGKKSALKSTSKIIVYYLPAFLIFVAFSVMHFQAKGWIGFHAGSPWAGSFERVNILGFMRNILIYAWRLIDFGRIGIWIVAGIIIVKYRSLVLKEERNKSLLLIFSITFLILPINMLWANNLLQHRYLLPIFILFALWVQSALFSEYISKSLRKIMITVWTIVLIGGNLVIYPDSVSQGWDASLAYLPINDLRHEAVKYLDIEGIKIEDVQAEFPFFASFHCIDLNKDYREFAPYQNNKKHVFYSNLCNLKRNTREEIFREYKVIKRFEHCGVYIDIYQKKQSE